MNYWPSKQYEFETGTQARTELNFGNWEIMMRTGW